METIIEFLLKSSAGIALFYLIYWFILRKETFHLANRWFLVGSLITSVLLPLFPLTYTIILDSSSNAPSVKTISDTFQHIPIISSGDELRHGFNWMYSLSMVYTIGMILFLSRLLFQTGALLSLMVRFKIKFHEGIRIVENEKYGNPFSFFNIVFINPKFHKQEDLTEILAHEKVHIREYHWFDLLLIELLTVIFWFNPFIWLFERSIKQNHEYLADRGVLSEGHGLSRYQAILVNQLMGMQVIGITNNLNFALSTNRLKMMTKTKTPGINRVKFMWILPVLAILFFAFAEPEYHLKSDNPDQIGIQANDMMMADKTIRIAGKVLDENDLPLPGTSVVVKGSTTGTVCDMDGTFSLDVPENASIVLSFVGKKTMEDSYSGITSGTKEAGVFQREYKMRDAVIVIDTDVPPPPPPPMARVGKEELAPPPPPPPPPPSVGKGEKEVFYIVEDMPKYEGGFNGLLIYVKRMQKKLAVQKGLKGKAKVGFTVNAKGNVTDIKIIEKDNDGAGNGAYEIVKGMASWTPGKQRGKAVPVKYLLPVEFK